jgi:hypothetical protein
MENQRNQQELTNGIYPNHSKGIKMRHDGSKLVMNLMLNLNFQQEKF